MSSFPGLGTVVNVAAIVAGSLLGMLLGHRLPARTHRVVTSCLGLTTLLMAGLSAASVASAHLTAAVGPSAPALIVLASLLMGGLLGSALRIEERLESLAGWVQRRVIRREGGKDQREQFIEGWLTASLLFCVGPMAILGSFDDGMGRGIDKLTLKAALDGFAALAFASSFGIGVLLSAVSVAVIQAALTTMGVMLGAMLPVAHVDALTATGGLLLVGISLRLLDVKQVPVGDLLPALLVAPVLTQVVVVFH